ncbi:hypothetical protein PULV_a2042 [Pseudoalteromonas ulvae UL12]|uniref:Uncharacterized protein n=1 Tax=Pseudoalteromonas ulvae TaxID=107327 RepID=A0A244CRH8_PSEDV|nr:TIGR02285 family protein [Pseudoalteromonas ulvae]MBE0365275.1 hypothetical protein [Pseudoalteromonas ulvae UL12]OUL57809.1 hypothetical protein B1199_12200 [Pseudoalteromonas ulvae]
MSWHRDYFQCVYLCLFLFACSANGQERIIWQLNHAPPSTIVHGQYKQQGFIDLILEQIIRKMPEYQHSIEVSSLAGSTFEIRSQKTVCLPALFSSPEREKFMLFSQASIVHPSNRLVFLNKNSKGIAGQQLDLAHLLARKDLYLGLDKSRSYGAVADAALADVEPISHVYRRASESPNGLIEMVALGRLDYTIAYPFQVQYYLQSNQLVGKSPLTMAQIYGQAAYSMGQVACPKNEWGKQVITRVNQVLNQLKPTQEYKAAMTRWWKESAQDPNFVTFYQQQFLNH